MFEVGSLHLTHGKTTISLLNRDRPERRRGLLEATPFRSGSRPDQAPFYGFMGNVSPPIPILPPGLMVLPPGSGRGKESSLVC